MRTQKLPLNPTGTGTVGSWIRDANGYRHRVYNLQRAYDSIAGRTSRTTGTMPGIRAHFQRYGSASANTYGWGRTFRGGNFNVGVGRLNVNTRFGANFQGLNQLPAHDWKFNYDGKDLGSLDAGNAFRELTDLPLDSSRGLNLVKESGIPGIDNSFWQKSWRLLGGGSGDIPNYVGNVRNVLLNWQKNRSQLHNIENFAVQMQAAIRNEGIKDVALQYKQGLDKSKWTAEDLINDHFFDFNKQLDQATFDAEEWKIDSHNKIGDAEATFGVNLANNREEAERDLAIRSAEDRASLDNRVAEASTRISTDLVKEVGAIQDKLSDSKGDLSDYAYEKNQQIENWIYQSSKAISKTGTIQDMRRVTDAWNEKLKMEDRANKKLFRGDHQQQQLFQDRVAQAQYKARLLSSGNSRGPVDMADPARAKRIAATSRMHGAQFMAAERLNRLATISDVLDQVENANEQNPENWNQHKKVLRMVLDQYEDL